MKAIKILFIMVLVMSAFSCVPRGLHSNKGTKPTVTKTLRYDSDGLVMVYNRK